MLILTSKNQSYNTDLASSNDTDDINFCILDMSVPKDADFYFNPLVFLESYNSGAFLLSIGKYMITLPANWHLLIGDPGSGDYEFIPLIDYNERDFMVPVLNPLTSFMPGYLNSEIQAEYHDVRWFFPRLSINNILAIPLYSGPNPLCCFAINEITGKKLDVIDASIFYR